MAGSYTFGSFRLDSSAEILFRGAELQPLGRRAVAVLRTLVERASEPVSKDALMKAAWPGLAVEEGNLTVQIASLRRVLGQEPGGERWIETLPRRGYRFMAEVQEVPGSGDPSPDAEVALEPPKPSLSLPDKPSIAVLAFTNLSGDVDQEYIADGIVDDIITELSRFSDLFVIARNSSFQYKGKAVDVRQIGRGLGVRYVLEGSVRRSGNRIRIVAQLIDAESGGHLWAQKYNESFADVLALQDSITEGVVRAIQPQILITESHRAARKSPINLNALDCCMRGTWHFYRGTPEDNRHAESWLRRSVDLDPTLARAHVQLGRVLAGRCWVGYSDDLTRDFEESLNAAERALTLDNHDPACQYLLAIVSLMSKRHERAETAAQRALQLNPNYALGYVALGATQIFTGRFAEALDPLARCLRLSPCDPDTTGFITLIALAHYHLGNYQSAIKYSERGRQGGETYVILRTMAAALGQLGRTADAHSVVAELERNRPRNSKRHWELTCPYSNPAHEAHLLEGLHKAGWA